MKSQVTYRIGAIGRVVTGKTPSTADPGNFGSDYPFLTPTDMQGMKWARRTERGLSATGASKLRCCVPSRSVAVSCIGWQMGKAILTDRPTYTNQQINTIIPNELADPDYLFYYFATRRDELLSIGSAGGVRTPIISKSAFEALEIRLPAVPIQRRIASILSAHDDLIENNVRRIAILEEMARRIYEEWFVRFRFPGCENMKMKKSESGPIPESFSVGGVGDIPTCRLVSENVARYEGKRAYFETSDVRGLELISRGTLYEFDNKPSRAQKVPVLNSVWFARMKDTFKVVLVSETNRRLAHSAIFSSGFAGIASSANVLPFLFMLLSSQSFQAEKDRFATGATQVALTNDGLSRIRVVIPPLSLIEEYAGACADMVAAITLYQEKNRLLRTTRDLLLPKLISGELDVSGLPEPETAAA